MWLYSKIGGDKIIWLVVLLLSIFSVLAVYSSTGTLAYKNHLSTEFYAFKHFSLLIFGLLLMFLAHLFNYRYYSRIAQLLLWISVPMLGYTLIWGTNLNEATRWIPLPAINMTFQTSDLAKMALIMYMARILSRKQLVIKDFKEAFVPIIGWPLLVCGLIAPANFSSAIVLFATCLLVMFIGRINLKYLWAVIVGGVVIMGIFFMLIMNLEDDMLPGRMPTWKSRIESYIGGQEDISFQTKQANIAIARGGITGQGPGNSIQRNFLPQPFSDFIYAIIIEEYGLIGGGLIVFLYLTLLYRSIKIVAKSPRAFGALLAVGLSFSLVIQAMINMGVAIGLFPVTGLTLPLVSMGGTSLWFTSISIGIILSVSRKIEELEQKERIS